jgi:hypothetical protein
MGDPFLFALSFEASAEFGSSNGPLGGVAPCRPLRRRRVHILAVPQTVFLIDPQGNETEFPGNVVQDRPGIHGFIAPDCRRPRDFGDCASTHPADLGRRQKLIPNCYLKEPFQASWRFSSASRLKCLATLPRRGRACPGDSCFKAIAIRFESKSPLKAAAE